MCLITANIHYSKWNAIKLKAVLCGTGGSVCPAKKYYLPVTQKLLLHKTQLLVIQTRTPIQIYLMQRFHFVWLISLGYVVYSKSLQWLNFCFLEYSLGANAIPVNITKIIHILKFTIIPPNVINTNRLSLTTKKKG